MIQQHINQQGTLRIRALKMLLSGPPCTGKTTTMRRLTNQLLCLDPNDSPVPSTVLDKPRTIELTSLLISDRTAWTFEDLKQQGRTLYSRILTSNTQTEDTPTTENVTTESLTDQLAVLTSLVEADDWTSVREKLSGVEDITLLHVIDSGGQPECHEILPLLLDGQVLTLVFLNLTHDLDKLYKVPFRPQGGSSQIKDGYESEFTTREVVQRILCSMTSLQSDTQKSAALIIGTYLDKADSSRVLTINNYIQKSLGSFISNGFLCPAVVKGDEKQYIVPLNNMTADQGDIDMLRKVILNIIGTQFQAEPMPTAWLLLNLLLRAKYEENRGWCTMEECIDIAAKCCINREQLPHVLKMIHERYGTLLHYSTVPGLCEKVLCTANIILLPFKRIFEFVFACDDLADYAEAEHIRKTGVISHKTLKRHCHTNSPDSIPTSEFINLLKDRCILYENNPSTNSAISYFMPCLLQADHSVVTEAGNPSALAHLNPGPLQLVPTIPGSLSKTYRCAYVPLGLFPAMVVKMSQTWEVNGKEVFRNRIQFYIQHKGEEAKVEFRQHVCNLELRLLPMSSKCSPINSVLLHSCRKQLWQALEEVSSKYPHMQNLGWKLGFYCPASLQPGGTPHVAVCLTDNELNKMKCLDPDCVKNNRSSLTRKHRCWLEVGTSTYCIHSLCNALIYLP